MPLYEYQCKQCEIIQEQVFSIEGKPDSVPCSCGGVAGKILSAGLVIGDEMPAWMRHSETLGCLQSSADRPIKTRSEYKRYLKKHNIVERSAKREI